MPLEYHLILPKSQINFDDTTLTFSIQNIRSRLSSVLYFILRCYDRHDTLIYTYNSPRWAIDTVYKRRYKTFDIGREIVDTTVYVQLELVSVGTSSENPLYFNGLMLNAGADIGVHSVPNQRVSRDIKFANTRYANLYDEQGNFLQVIRPKATGFSTDLLTKSECTVIAPHFYDESDIDDPVNVFYEFINQAEQRIDVLR